MSSLIAAVGIVAFLLKCCFFCLSDVNKKRTMLPFFVEQKENRCVPGFVQSQIGRNSIQARSHPCFHFFGECSDNCLGMLHCSIPPVDFLKIIIVRLRWRRSMDEGWLQLSSSSFGLAPHHWGSTSHHWGSAPHCWPSCLLATHQWPMALNSIILTHTLIIIRPFPV